MNIPEKINQIERLLLSHLSCKSEKGIQWVRAFNEGEVSRRSLDPSGKFYDRARLMQKGIQRKLKELPVHDNLSVAECEEYIRAIAPQATCDQKGILQNNVIGAYKALRMVTERYPEVSMWLKQYSSIKGANSIAKKQKEVMEKALQNDPRVLEYKKSINEWKDNQRYENWAYRTKAKYVAQQYGVSNRKAVKNWMKENGEYSIASKEFYDIVVETKAEIYLKDFIRDLMSEDIVVPKDASNMLACAGMAQGVWIGNILGGKYDYVELMPKNVETGYHPPYDKEYDGATAVLAHEFGHVLDYMTNAREDQEIKAIWNSSFINKMKEISTYAGKSCGEMIAEAFAEYLLCKNPRGLAKRIGERLNALYEEQYGSTK